MSDQGILQTAAIYRPYKPSCVLAEKGPAVLAGLAAILSKHKARKEGLDEEMKVHQLILRLN